MEKTLIIIKPDAVKRKLIGNIINFFEEKQVSLILLKMMKISKNQAQEFYSDHKTKFFFDELTDYLSSGNIIVIVLEGKNIISNVRTFVGNTDPKKANLNTVRSKFGISKTENSIHASDSILSAKKEILFFFKNHL